MSWALCFCARVTREWGWAADAAVWICPKPFPVDVSRSVSVKVLSCSYWEQTFFFNEFLVFNYAFKCLCMCSCVSMRHVDRCPWRSEEGIESLRIVAYDPFQEQRMLLTTGPSLWPLEKRPTPPRSKFSRSTMMFGRRWLNYGSCRVFCVFEGNEGYCCCWQPWLLPFLKEAPQGMFHTFHSRITPMTSSMIMPKG